MRLPTTLPKERFLFTPLSYQQACSGTRTGENSQYVQGQQLYKMAIFLSEFLG